MIKNKIDALGLISVIHLKWTRFLQKRLLQHKINLKQIFILKRLSESDFLYPAEIAEYLFCDRPTATVIIRNLEKNGWVRKEKDPENKKRLKVMLTKLGKEKFNSIPQVLYQTDKLDINPLSALDKSEQIQLHKILEKLRKNMPDTK